MTATDPQADEGRVGRTAAASDGSLPVEDTQPHINLADKAIFAALYEEAHQSVYRYVYGIRGGPAQEVEDLTAITFEKAWNARKRFVGSKGAAVGWLMTIAKRSVVDAYRKKERRGGTHADLDSIPPVVARDTPERRAERNEQSEMLWVLLEKLPDNKREIIVLRYMLGWPVNQIADHLHIRQNTVSVTIHRSLKELREMWPTHVPVTFENEPEESTIPGGGV